MCKVDNTLMGKTTVDGTADMWEVDYRQREKMTVVSRWDYRHVGS